MAFKEKAIKANAEKASEEGKKESTLFWKLYAKCQDSLYHLMPYRKLLWDCLQELDLKPGMRILDANCSTGNFEHFLSEKEIPSIKVEAISHSPIKLERAAEKCKSLNFVNFNKSDIYSLKFKNNTFDGIFCKNTFFLFKNIDLILRELYRVLKPNGKLVLVTPKSNFLFDALAYDHLRRIRNISGAYRKFYRLLQSEIILPRSHSLVKSIFNKAAIKKEQPLISSVEAQNIIKRNGFKECEMFLSNAGQNWVINSSKTSTKQDSKPAQKPIRINLNNGLERKKVHIREATSDDIQAIYTMEKAVWGEERAATINQIRSRIETIPPGNLVAEVDEGIVGYISFLLLDYSIFESNCDKTWYKITDNGYASTHNHKGRDLFGINLSVFPNAPRNVSRLLILAVAKKGIKFKVKRYILGSRIPTFYKYSDNMSVKAYVEAKSSSGNYLDPELHFYRQKGLKVMDIVPNYFRDSQSNNYGVIVKQDNPFAKMPLKLFSKAIAHLPLNTVKLIDRFN